MIQQLVLFSCEHDTDHEGHNGPWEMCKSNHDPSKTRANAHLFPGTNVCGLWGAQEIYLGNLDILSGTFDS